jgi:hypothetical protein
MRYRGHRLPTTGFGAAGDRHGPVPGWVCGAVPALDTESRGHAERLLL